MQDKRRTGRPEADQHIHTHTPSFHLTSVSLKTAQYWGKNSLNVH